MLVLERGGAVPRLGKCAVAALVVGVATFAGQAQALAAGWDSGGVTYSRAQTKELNQSFEEHGANEAAFNAIVGTGCAAATGPGAPACAAMVGAASFNWALIKDAAKQAVNRNQCLRLENQRTRAGDILVPKVDSSSRCAN